ncbi:hypothetical protein D3C80_671640 [compost metagenome]
MTWYRTNWAYGITKANAGWYCRAISTSSAKRQRLVNIVCNTLQVLAVTSRQCGTTVPEHGCTLPISH